MHYEKTRIIAYANTTPDGRTVSLKNKYGSVWNYTIDDAQDLVDELLFAIGEVTRKQ